MIGLLRGKIIKDGDNSAIVDVNGTGYEITMPASEFDSLEDKQEVTLYTHLSVRDDAFNLYAFTTPESRQMFRMLIEVSGVGPRAAMNILSVFSTHQLLDILSEGQEIALQKVHGIGKKTAARLCVDLRDKASKLHSTLPDGTSQRESKSYRTDGKQTGISADVLSALMNLGYRPSEAEMAMSEAKSLLSANQIQDFEMLFKASLKLLAG